MSIKTMLILNLVSLSSMLYTIESLVVLRELCFATDHTAILDIVFTPERINNFPPFYNMTPERLEEKKQKLKTVLFENGHMSSALKSRPGTDKWFVLCHKDARLIGVVNCFVLENNPYIGHRNPVGFIDTLAMKKEYYHLYNDLLYREAEEYLKKEGCIAVTATVAESEVDIYKEKQWKISSVRMEKSL